MIWIITRREIHDNLLSSRFALATIVCLLLVVLSSYVSIRDYEKRMEDYSVGIQEQKGPDAAYYPKVYRKPEVLSILSQGLERKLGILANAQDYFRRGIVDLSGEMGYMGRRSVYLDAMASIDFGLVVKVVMSLLAIFLAYDAVSGEREAGVLKLSMANAVPRAHILIGKFLGGVFCLCIPLAMSSIVALVVIQLSGVVDFGAPEWWRLGVIFLLAMLYLSMFYALGLFISCLTKRSAMSLMLSMLIWIFLVIIIPNVGPALVKQYNKRTSKQDMLIQLSEMERSNWEEYQKKFKDAEDNEETKRKQQEHWQESARKLHQLTQKHTRELEQETKRGRLSMRLSPASAFTFASSTFARTDVGTYSRFKENVYAFFKQVESFHNLHNEDREEYDRLANEYKYSFKMSEPISASLRDAVPDIVLLLFFTVIFFMGAYASFLRYDVR